MEPRTQTHTRTYVCTHFALTYTRIVHMHVQKTCNSHCKTRPDITHPDVRTCLLFLGCLFWYHLVKCQQLCCKLYYSLLCIRISLSQLSLICQQLPLHWSIVNNTINNVLKLHFSSNSFKNNIFIVTLFWTTN